MATGCKPCRVTRILALALVVTAGAHRAASAAPHTWNGVVNSFWAQAGNWTPVGPVGAGDDLTFPVGAANLSNTNDTVAGTVYNSISLTGPVSGYNLAGNGIGLAGGLAAANAGSNNITFPIALSASQTFQASGDRLILSGAVSLGANTLTFDTDTDGVFQVEADILGTGGVIVTGQGVVFFNDPTSYSGPTTVNDGFFVPTTLNVASVVTVNGGQLQLANGASVGPVTVNAGGEVFVGGGLTQNGNLTDLTMQPGSDLTLDVFSASNYGTLNASGAVNLGGATLNFGGFVSTTGDVFTIINKTSGGAIVGIFDGLPEGSVFFASGRAYRITYQGDDGNDVVLTDEGAEPLRVTEIPTLAGAGLLVLGVLVALGGVLILRRSA